MNWQPSFFLYACSELNLSKLPDQVMVNIMQFYTVGMTLSYQILNRLIQLIQGLP